MIKFEARSNAGKYKSIYPWVVIGVDYKKVEFGPFQPFVVDTKNDNFVCSTKEESVAKAIAIVMQERWEKDGMPQLEEFINE